MMATTQRSACSISKGEHFSLILSNDWWMVQLCLLFFGMSVESINERLLTCYNNLILVVFDTLLAGDIFGQAASNNGWAYFRQQ